MKLSRRERRTYAGTTAVVVGGSEGIGKAIAARLLECGATVVIAGRTASKLEAAAANLARGRQVELHTRPVDVADPVAVEGLASWVVDTVGTPHWVINCAGFARPGYLDAVPTSSLQEMLTVNSLGTAHVAQAFLPHLKQAGRGHLVATSSIAGFLGLFGYTGYCASKYAVMGFCEALKREVKPFGIGVSVLCPPNTTTPGLERENQFKPAEVLATEEKVKVASPESVAAALLQGVARGRFMIIPTFDGRLARWLQRYFPWLLEPFLKRPLPAA